MRIVEYNRLKAMVSELSFAELLDNLKRTAYLLKTLTGGIPVEECGDAWDEVEIFFVQLNLITDRLNSFNPKTK